MFRRPRDVGRSVDVSIGERVPAEEFGQLELSAGDEAVGDGQARDAPADHRPTVSTRR
jgi:hypothetical protein